MAETDGGDRDDRRAEPRHLTCFPFHVQRGERGQTGGVEIALIRDLSPAGALLYTSCQTETGSRLKLHLDLEMGSDEARVVEAKVLRVSPLDAEARNELWKFGVTVQFDEP